MVRILVIGTCKKSLSGWRRGLLTLDPWMDQGFFLMKGLPKVRAEFSLTVFSYNLKRALKVLGTQKLIQAVS